MSTERRKTYFREWRLALGLSLEAAAAALGTSGATLSRIERGRQPYNQDLLEKAAALYGCDPAELLVQDPDDGTRVIRLMGRADAGQRRAIAAVAESLLNYRGEE
jgi:transcriptional regulator with XRE-family HTH domain